MLYEVAVLVHPSKEDQKKGKLETLEFGPEFVVADDTDKAVMSMIIDNAAKLAELPRDRMEILIRPFG